MLISDAVVEPSGTGGVAWELELELELGLGVDVDVDVSVGIVGFILEMGLLEVEVGAIVVLFETGIELVV